MKSHRKVLVISGEPKVCFVLSEQLKGKGFSVMEAPDGKSGIDAVGREKPGSVLLGHGMPGMDGFETMAGIRKIDPDLPVIFITGRGDVSVAVEAMRKGAYDFITKPPDIEALAHTIGRAMEKYELKKEVKRLNCSVGLSLECILGKSRPVRKIISQAAQVAPTDFSIILQGETGSGKSTIAEIIHNISKRRDRPFIRVDIGVIPENLVESELFGHEKGAFTGADRSKKGYFELAHRGTLFIDELQNMPPAVQGKLLSAVEQKKVYPVGGIRPVETDVRIIAASNAELKTLVKEKRFREDLFFRLSEFIISIPPLRERADEIALLAERFLREACTELGKNITGLSPEATEILRAYAWPGNIRELKNVVRRAVLLAEGPELYGEHFDYLLNPGVESEGGFTDLALKSISARAASEAEKKVIRKVLESLNGNKLKAASVLKVDYKTLLSKVKRYGL